MHCQDQAVLLSDPEGLAILAAMTIDLPVGVGPTRNRFMVIITVVIFLNKMDKVMPEAFMQRIQTSQPFDLQKSETNLR
ncbi:hypothetical protein [Ruegeria atlantica]|uniref:hypothetical protein n=1 Tax=Ruegeria atlantica TaxID=81569 RepID=UPI00147B9CFD|nr:hypothetical protein [Ruegeria atlantica]